MLELLRELFASDGYMPHGHCYLWNPGLVALHVASDALIGTAYVVIALTLWQLVRRIKLPFSPMILAFGVFIGACGLTHYMEVFTLWVPDYWLSGFVKLVTAVASVATGAYLLQARPLIVQVTRSAALAERRRVELETKNVELSTLYARVKDLDDAKTRFFANVSHELRTPLALVLGPVEKALASGLPEATRSDLEVARRSARALLRHVDDLLDVARLEEGRMPVRWAAADLARVVREAAAPFEALARERRVALTVDAPEELPAEVDAEKLDRVLANLLGNAFRHVRDGGRVRCALRREGARARVWVEDDGPGIPPALREAVFERFRQGAGREAGGGGAGLGLAIARDFVELHGGRIEAGEAEGGGARLSFEVPLRAPAGRAVEPAAAGRAGAGAGAAAVEALREAPAGPASPEGSARPVVLVVEDHPDMRRLTSDALEPELRVVTASDGEEALQTAEALQPDLVLTDVMMPRMSGERLLAELRARPRLAGTPVLVLTARADDEQRAALLRAGAVDYVTKPFQPEELRARVRTAVAVKRSREVLGRELAQSGGALEDLARELAQRKRELELAAESARVAREQAERASEVKSTFLGMLSHELRTPLTSMTLALAALESREGPLTERQRLQVDRIARASARLLGLIDAMLEYTRIESGRLVVRLEDVDLPRLAAEVVDEALPQAQRKLLPIDLEAGPMPPVRTDPRLLRLVLVNLVVNAVKYTERGRVKVTLRHGPDGHLVEVADTGPGIPPAERARVFEPFHQLSKPGTAPGVGLGLSLVKGVTEALGAALSVESALGQGTTFRVRVPPAERA
ncbi:ATP-binding response regulator [Anaeromyxobacter diazotrophicus]|uniref:histidine kinase n=1 Tax=Anaeromyxobacter diazotrophicus TaxID=2590199 RepID=A0A7I9VH61_9BACT|nr:ATP-binding protein [Anaeromyxobacter diazotrophicus]GEJ55732.1 ATPase [Anaeromyxobacter diazotrophicus]